MSTAVRRIGAAAAVSLMILAFYFSWNAAQTAKDLATSRAQDEYVRANSSCKSSKALRSLLNDLGVIIVAGARDVSPESLAEFEARIHQYTDTNPNCENLPVEPAN